MTLENTEISKSILAGSTVDFPVGYSETLPELRYENNPDFNQSIDEEYDLVTICDASFQPSKILFLMEPETYRLALKQFRDQEVEDLKETIFYDFPTPIAYNFYRFEKGYENEQQRLLLLRDTWESIICLLYSMVVGEFRCLNLPMKETAIRHKQLVSDTYHDKLSVIEQLIKLALDNNYNLSCIKIIPMKAIEKLSDLQAVRNDFAHGSAKSNEQCRQIIFQHYDNIISIFKDIEELKNATLMRYVGQLNNILEFRHEEFKGSSLNRTFEKTILTKEQLISVSSYLNDQTILVKYESHLYSISPFTYFKKDETGNYTRLCFYKRKKGEESNLQLFYELIGGFGEIEIAEDEFKADFKTATEELRLLLPDLSGKTGGKSA
ncbi:MAG: hypothetical protein HEQ19_06405 [Gloeotrichia echinulata CP02]|jgi:hypothetical protein|nr:hypothetical protein [Gloeotrichia echinulata DEX184]